MGPDKGRMNIVNFIKAIGNSRDEKTAGNQAEGV